MCAARVRNPESVLVVVYTDEAEVLLLKRSQPFAFWQSVTGSLDDNEAPDAAARRELREETGLTTEGRLSDCDTVRTFEIDPRWRDRFPPGITHNREHEWRYRLPGRVDVVLDRKEHSRVEWCPIEEAISRVWSWTNREALQDLRDKL